MAAAEKSGTAFSRRFNSSLDPALTRRTPRATAGMSASRRLPSGPAAKTTTIKPAPTQPSGEGAPPSPSPNARRRKGRTVKRLADEAEALGRCIVAHDHSDAMCLNRAFKAGKLISPMPRLFARPEYWNELKPEQQVLHTIRALQILHPDWVFASSSAAIVLGLSVSYKYLWPIRIAVPRKAHTKSDTTVFKAVVDNDKTLVINDVNVTSLARTAYDCLREMDFASGLAVADSLLRRFSVDRDQLVGRIDSYPHSNAGWRHAHETAEHADPRAESGGESIARAKMLLLGYAKPDLQVEMTNSVDGGSYRTDFGWDCGAGHRILGELDGAEKYVNPQMTHGAAPVDVLRGERLRESRISAHDVRIMRFSYDDMMDTARFRRILDTFGVPKTNEPLYRGDGKPYAPARLTDCRRAVRAYQKAHVSR